jgi:hypothetical protein
MNIVEKHLKQMAVEIQQRLLEDIKFRRVFKSGIATQAERDVMSTKAREILEDEAIGLTHDFIRNRFLIGVNKDLNVVISLM